ncbi:MAG: hypothetical protein M3461_04310 [Pseudomonadota bacterium]|nr:hypothetical protein [Pseudomonadota bacterium]
MHGLVLRGAKKATDAGVIVPVLVGPKAKINASAEAKGLDLSAYECGISNARFRQMARYWAEAGLDEQRQE